MPEPTIKNGEEHFFINKYKGNGGGQRVGRFLPFSSTGSITNSIIFNDDDNAYLSRTNDAGDRTRATISFWVKRGKTATTSQIFDSYDGSSTNDGFIRFNSNDTISLRIGSPSNNLYTTNRTFEDNSKFYHIMLSIDTNLSTAADRVKLYVDGDRITSFSTQTNAGSGDNTQFNYSSATFRIGSTTSGNYDFDGYLSEFIQIDGQALLPASFGETDTSTGRWVPATVRPYPTTTTSIAVTVVSSGGNKYALDGVTQATATLVEGATYRFDQSDNSNSGHPLRFSSTSNGTHGGGSEYTVGVTTAGTPGSSGAYTEITVASGAPTLYYYCTQHSGMGGTANTPAPYGENGFRLQFGTNSALGTDTSGNSNNLTSTNLATTDQTTDTPSKNFPIIDRFRSALTESEGNTIGTATGTGVRFAFSTMTFDPFDSTGYYMEFKLIQHTYSVVGFRLDDETVSSSQSYQSDGYVSLNSVNDWRQDNTITFDGSDVLANNDIVGVYIKDGKVYYSINGTMQNSSNSVCAFKPGRYRITIGHNANYSPYASVQIICPQSKWTYTPSGVFADYREINQQNLQETGKGVTGLTWIKDRDNAYSHGLRDSSRGRHKDIFSNLTQAEVTNTDGVQKFLKGGIQIEDLTGLNASGADIVSWNWVANSGTTTSNSNGTITSTTQVNSQAGFSIVQYTGTGSNATVGHGLAAAPEWILFKNLDNGSEGWSTYHTSLTSAAYILTLNNTNAQASSATDFNSTAPTSSVFSVGTNARTNNSSQRIVAYCWHSVSGFSKFGKYTGNGNANGPFIYTGFKVRWLMHKANNGASWYIYDTVRDQNNPALFPLFGDTTGTESSNTQGIDLLSNGFKLRQATGYGANYSGVDVYYMAFAEHPFIGDGTSPVTAR